MIMLLINPNRPAWRPGFTFHNPNPNTMNARETHVVKIRIPIHDKLRQIAARLADEVGFPDFEQDVVDETMYSWETETGHSHTCVTLPMPGSIENKMNLSTERKTLALAICDFADGLGIEDIERVRMVPAN